MDSGAPGPDNVDGLGRLSASFLAHVELDPALPSEGRDPSREKVKLAGDHLVMLEMHMAGFTNKEIAESLGCTPQTVCNTVTCELGKEYVAERVAGLDAEFFGLYRKVIQTVADGLDPNVDLSVRLTAADKWLKAHGRYSPKPSDSVKVSAEDIVARLLAGQGINIHDSQVIINPPTARAAALTVEEAA